MFGARCATAARYRNVVGTLAPQCGPVACTFSWKLARSSSDASYGWPYDAPPGERQPRRDDGEVTSPPGGVLTFLFTDLEGSTAAWERDARAMDTALRRHDRVVSTAIAQGGGYVFSRAGDSFAAAFASPSDAVRAAVQAQRELKASVGRLDLAVRMGLHTGEANERDGDYFGPVVNRAARLMATAHGGQVVCSQLTAQLATTTVSEGVALVELGTFRLKDLLLPETVFEVRWFGLDRSFPPLRTLEAVRHNLPLQHTTLIGRDTEIARVAKAVRASRLVTLTGIGGCGKTRLALAAAAELASGFSDGVVFVPLATVARGEQIARAVEEALEARVSAPEAAAMATFLARRDTLLVLDNCEHILDEVAGFVEVVLAAGTGPRILATSRQVLDVEGEYAMRVPSLSLDGGAGDPPALRLLTERAKSARGQPVEATHRSALLEICARLDGIPLAIELAAAQLVYLTPGELLSRLDQRFDLLVGGRGERRRRQQTLQTVMDWSWDLLTPDEQQLLAVLSVFRGTWTLDQAEDLGQGFVAGGIPGLIRSLVGKSLVDHVPTGDGQNRYRLLESVRLYADARLTAGGQRTTVLQRHLDTHLDRVRLLPPEQYWFDLDLIEQLAASMTDIASAVERALSDGAYNAAGELVAHLLGSFATGTYDAQGEQWVQQLETQIDDPVLRSRVLVAGGCAAVGAGHHALCDRWVAKAFTTAEDVDPLSRAVAGMLYAAPRMLLDPVSASNLLTASLAAATQHGAPKVIAMVHPFIEMALFCDPELPLTYTPLDPDAYGGSRCLSWDIQRKITALRLALDGRVEDAHALLERPAIKDQWWTAELAALRVAVEAVGGDPRRAISTAPAVMRDIDRVSDVIWHAEMVLVLGIAQLRAGRADQALVTIEAAKRAPMMYPYWYALARRFGREARRQLDPAEVERSLGQARTSSVEDILDAQLR